MTSNSLGIFLEKYIEAFVYLSSVKILVTDILQFISFNLMSKVKHILCL